MQALVSVLHRELSAQHVSVGPRHPQAEHVCPGAQAASPVLPFAQQVDPGANWALVP